MKKNLIIILLAAFCFTLVGLKTNYVVAAAPELTPSQTVETAFGSVAASYEEKLAERVYRSVDFDNGTDCDVQIRMDDVSGTPHTVVRAGTAETINFWELGGWLTTSLSLQYMTGESCTSGSVYMKGIY